MNRSSTYSNHLDTEEARWFAIYTAFKREKLVKRLLDQKGIECYLPLLNVTRRYTRKIRKLELPLISCYLFVKIVKNEYVPVLETEHVLKFIRFSKNLISIPEEEIDLIRRVTGEGIPIEVEETLFNEGDEVEIISGNLTGLRGKLISKAGKKKVAIELENLGYSMQLTLDLALLRKVGKGVYA